MQKQLLTLVCMLLISALLVACIGAYLKIEILSPIGLFRDKSWFEVPFAVLTDPAARFALKNQMNRETEPQTEPSTEPATLPPTELPTELPTEIPTELPSEIPTEASADHIPDNHRPNEEIPLPTEPPPTDPAYIDVTEDWFDDVLFIGDSRTVGLREYARLGDADYFCSVGMTVFDATEQQLSDLNFSTTNLEGLLRSKRYSKIYISLGLNECGYPYDLLMEGYHSLLGTVRKHQPQTVIILHGMITVSRIKAASEWYFSLENLQKVNAGIRDFADGNMVRYIDANEHFADEEGYLPSDLTADGCHFYISGYQEWAQWIYENAKTLDISFG